LVHFRGVIQKNKRGVFRDSVGVSKVEVKVGIIETYSHYVIQLVLSSTRKLCKAPITMRRYMKQRD